MDMTLSATRGIPASQEQGWGWTWSVRALAISLAASATMAAGASMPAHAAAVHAESVIVRGAAGCTASVATTIAQLGGRMTHSLGILNGASAVLSSDRIAALRANPCVSTVTADGSLTLSSIGGYDPTASVGSLYNTTQMIGAQAYWQAGYTGRGVDVALIDSGVSPVLGLAGGQVVNGPDISFDSQSPNLVSLDGYGHGTHMAGIIAGHDPMPASPLGGGQPASGLPIASTSSATSSGDGGYGGKDKNSKDGGGVASGAGNGYSGNATQFLGVAPDANIVSVKVADAHGATDVSQVIAGLDWTVQHAHDAGRNIRVINLSFGTDGLQGYQLDPLAFAAEQAWLDGIVVVVAAGNGGAATTSLANPAIDPFVIAVGAADTSGSVATADDAVAGFSNSGSASRAPDLVAPGVHIEGLRVPGSSIDAQFGSTATVADRFFLGSGTSQATAVVSGAAALVLQQFPNASPDQVKALLTLTATPLAGQAVNRQGHGELNLTPALGIGGGKGKAPKFKQKFALSSGTGSLEGSRGTLHLVNNGTTLAGEQDIFGTPWNSATMAASESNQAAWNGGTFNGGGWSGGGWSGGGWSGGGWSNNVWTGGGWSGGGWSGGGWSGGGWADSVWA